MDASERAAALGSRFRRRCPGRVLGTRRAAPGPVRLAAGLTVLLTVVLGGALGPFAAPAAAHTVGGVEATNYRTRVTAHPEPFPGVAVRPVDAGNQLELTNDGPRDVVVEGYDGEPYLRVGPRGVFENRNSPATYLNRSRLDPAPPPARADPGAAPAWRRTSTGHSVRWHDHRAHWMGTVDPPAVRRAPDRAQLVQRFSVPVVVGDRTVRVRGDVWWIPGPSPWPWVVGAVGAAVLVVALACTRRAGPAIGGALAGAVAASVLHAAGSWSTGATSVPGRLGAALPTIGAVVLGGAALVVLVRRGLGPAAPLLVFAGLFVTIAVGLADLAALTNSQVPTVLAVGLDRATVALALGLGAGVTVGAALHVAERGVPSPAGDRPDPAPGQN